MRLLEEGADQHEDTVKALSYLADYYKNTKDYGKAEACCMQLLDYAGPEKQLAKALLREIHALQEAAAERAEDTSMADVN